MKFHIESGGFSLHVYKSLKAVKLTEGTNLAIKKVTEMVNSGHLKLFEMFVVNSRDRC